ncbi:MAG: type VI secretion system baseplate subunit TssF, partial [Candidatus Acidiferrum sp.]
GQSDDPHVERLLQGFAFLAGRIHHKLDDEFPELTDALLNVLYPHYLAPIPSMALIQFEADPRAADLANGFLVPRHTLLRTNAVDKLRCSYRTAFAIKLWPITLVEARLQPPPFGAALSPPPGTAAALRLRFDCGGPEGFAGLSLDALRIHLAGESAIVPDLYELICNDTLRMLFRPVNAAGPPTNDVVIGSDRIAETLVPAGFGRDEGLLPYPSHALPGYRLLTEFFTYPAKFHFVDVGGWREVAARRFGAQLELILFLRRTLPGREHTVSAASFRLGCTPIVNLFPQTVEPRALDQKLAEYPLVPDADHPRGMEVHSVRAVRAVGADGGSREYRPFYSFRHGIAREMQRAFWYAARRPSPGRGDSGTDVAVTLVDLDFKATRAPDETLVVETLCTNRNLPARLRQLGEDIALESDIPGPRMSIRCVRAPTLPLRMPPGRGTYWRLISHLSLNHLSLADGSDGLHALK